MGLKIGVCGTGRFALRFIPLFQAHPDVEEVVLADLMADRLVEAAREHRVRRTFPSLEALCASDVDAVAIFSQRWQHGPQAAQALSRGKHVYSAVPAAVTIDELGELVRMVTKTGLVYMLGETSYYRPQTIWCRERFAKGKFGRFVYGEGQYHHDMSRFYRSYMGSGGEEWKRIASFPPMLYPTHSVAHVLAVTFRRMTEVSGLGFADEHADGIFRKELSLWGNRFSNETGLFRTSDGGMARINEFRRIGAGESRMIMSIMGTLGAYEEQEDFGVWNGLEIGEDYLKDGEIDFARAPETVKHCREDVSWVHELPGVEITEANLGNLPREYLGRKHLGVSRVHPVTRLPQEFVGLENRHFGAHQFLVVDFLEAIKIGKLPPNHVWQAARYNAPGIVAHESAQRDGEKLRIPDFGLPPAGAELIDPLAELKE